MVGNPREAFLQVQMQGEAVVDGQFFPETVPAINRADLCHAKSDPVVVLTGDAVRPFLPDQAILFPLEVVGEAVFVYTFQ